MDIFYSALGIVLGTSFFALSGFGVLVPAILCLVSSTLAFTTLRKYHIQILSLLSFILLSFLSFSIRQEYYEYFAKDKIQTQGQVFRITKTKNASFFSEKVFLKPIAKNLLDDYTNPIFIWSSKNFKALKRNDLIQFNSNVKLKKIEARKRRFYRKDRIFYRIENKDFDLVGSKSSKIDKLQDSIKRFYKEHLKPENAELALGLILGGQNAQIDQKTITSIRNLGLGHFFSASGFHLLILLLIIFWISKQVPLVSQWQKPIAISLILLYMTLVNFSPSITRAGIMAIAYLLFKGSNRRIDSFRLLIVLAAIVLVIDPHTALDIGFQFSYLATLGIITWYKDLENKLSDFIQIKWLREIVAVSLSTQLLIFPLVIYYFSNLQLWSLIANIIFTPILSLVTILSFTGIYFILDPILSLLRYLFDLSQNLPFVSSYVDVNITSVVLMWIFLFSASCYLLKNFSSPKGNPLLNFLKSKEGQLAFMGSALMLFLATNLEPYNVRKLDIKNGKINNGEYKAHFDQKSHLKYFDLDGKTAVLINNLNSITAIKDNIREVNLVFIPNLNSNFIYLNKLIKLFKPELCIVSAKSETTKVKHNLSLISSHSNTIYGDAHIYLSRDKFWKVTN